MRKNFEDSFREFIAKRLNEDFSVTKLNSKELLETNEEIDQYYEKMLIAFTENDKEAFVQYLDKYTSLQGCIVGICEDLAYLQGMKDLYKFIKILEEEREED